MIAQFATSFLHAGMFRSPNYVIFGSESYVRVMGKQRAALDSG